MCKWILSSLALVTALSLCSCDYFRVLTSFSNVVATANEDGKIGWKGTIEDNGNYSGLIVTTTDPSVNLTSDNLSERVVFTNVDVYYYDGLSIIDSKNRPAQSSPLYDSGDNPITAMRIPFTAAVGGDSSAATGASTGATAGSGTKVQVHILGTEVVNATQPANGKSAVPHTIFAEAILKGTNSFGQGITATVDIPIAIDYSQLTRTSAGGVGGGISG